MSSDVTAPASQSLLMTRAEQQWVAFGDRGNKHKGSETALGSAHGSFLAKLGEQHGGGHQTRVHSMQDSTLSPVLSLGPIVALKKITHLHSLTFFLDF